MKLSPDPIDALNYATYDLRVLGNFPAISGTIDDAPTIDGLLDVSDYRELVRREGESDMELVYRAEIATIRKVIELCRQGRATGAMANYLETLIGE